MGSLQDEIVPSRNKYGQGTEILIHILSQCFFLLPETEVLSIIMHRDWQPDVNDKISKVETVQRTACHGVTAEILVRPGGYFMVVMLPHSALQCLRSCTRLITWLNASSQQSLPVMGLTIFRCFSRSFMQELSKNSKAERISPSMLLQHWKVSRSCWKLEHPASRRENNPLHTVHGR